MQLQDLTRDRTIEDLDTDIMLSLAVERLLENVGEALRRVRDAHPEVTNPYPQINEWIAQRNIIAHLYDGIDNGIIWDSATVRSSELIQILDNLESEIH